MMVDDKKVRGGSGRSDLALRLSLKMMLVWLLREDGGAITVATRVGERAEWESKGRRGCVRDEEYGMWVCWVVRMWVLW